MRNFKVYYIGDCSNDEAAIKLVPKVKAICICTSYCTNLKDCISIYKDEKIELFHDIIGGVYIYSML